MQLFDFLDEEVSNAVKSEERKFGLSMWRVRP
jgi:hypothetical protein